MVGESGFTPDLTFANQRHTEALSLSPANIHLPQPSEIGNAAVSEGDNLEPTRKSVSDPAGNRTTPRPPDHRKQTQTALVWSCLPFIMSGQNHHRKNETEITFLRSYFSVECKYCMAVTNVGTVMNFVL